MGRSGKKLLLNCKAYLETFLKIQNKDGKLAPFLLNEPQQRFYEIIRQQWQQKKPVRVIVLKARQMGISTVTEGMIFWGTATASHVESMIVAHKDEATRQLFLMSKRFYDNLPEEIKPMQRASNAQELWFDTPSRYKGSGKGLSSRIRCATAGGSGIGRSFTIRFLHCSEYAFWPGDKKDTLTGLLQAVPDSPGTMIVIESTANGFNEFKQLWDDNVTAYQRGEDCMIPVFFPWYKMQEYRRPVPPGFQRTAEEADLAKTFSLDDEQLSWRRWCIRINCSGDVDQFRQEYPATPDEAFIATGRCVFDKNALVLRRAQVEGMAWEYGSFRIIYDGAQQVESYVWEPDPKGPIRIRVKPEPGVPYVLSGDTAGTGTDFFAGHVLDNRTGEQAAVIHHQMGERMFAEQAYCLGMYYNEALIGVETNYSTYVQLKLEELGYHNFYVREVIDTYTGKLRSAFGFDTNRKSRPLIIDGLKDVAKYSLETIYDYATLGEMLTFVYREETWRPEAENGEHDDLVMSLAIAHHIRSQQRTSVAAQTARKKAKWSQDMIEDYDRASERERQILLRLWGEPE